MGNLLAAAFAAGMIAEPYPLRDQWYAAQLAESVDALLVIYDAFLRIKSR